MLRLPIRNVEIFHIPTPLFPPPIIFPDISISLYCVISRICVATSKLKDFIIDWNSNSDTVLNGWRFDFGQRFFPFSKYVQMMWIRRSSEILLDMSVEHMRRLSKGIERYSFFNSVFVSSKRRLSRLTRGCADIDIYSVAWALSWTRICQQHIGRSNRSRSKWRGRLCNYILHELFADRTNLLGQRGTEHHDLLAVRCASEYFLYVPAHICNSNAAQLIIYQSKWDVKYSINFKESLSW